MLSSDSSSERKKTFKFANFLTSHPEFLPTVEKEWPSSLPLFISTTAIYRLTKKLKALKRFLRVLGKDMLGDLSKRTNDLFQQLCAKQSETLQCPSEEATEAEAIAYHNWLRLSNIEEEFLKQKSKRHWLQVGDRNNSYFQRMATVRQMRNSIKELKGDDGTIFTKVKEVKTEAVRYYNDLLNNMPSSYEGCSVTEL